MRRRYALGLVLFSLASEIACILNPQPIPPEDLEGSANDASFADGAQVAVDDAGSSVDADSLKEADATIDGSYPRDAAPDVDLDARADADGG